MKKSLVPIVVILLLLLIIVLSYPRVKRNFFEPTETSLEEGVTLTDEELIKEMVPKETYVDDSRPDIEIVARGLSVPWDIAFVSLEEFFVTERPGTLLYFKDGKHTEIAIDGVRDRGEGGLLGVVIHPDYKKNGYIYLYKSSNETGENVNEISRYVFEDGELTDRRVIIGEIPGAVYHDGGRMAFGPDGKLYVTTGDATNPAIAQDLDSLGGKILRMNDDGSIPTDNPIKDSLVYSLGHRNPQGLTWDEKGQLWSTEHGPSSTAPNKGQDEVNLIFAGSNYGWPTIKGEETAEGMITPKAQSGISETWAPASALYWGGSVFFGGLRGEALYEAIIDKDEVVDIKVHFRGVYGRIRSIVLGPDGHFYITTSNRDGRGKIQEGDDKIIRINPRIFR